MSGSKSAASARPMGQSLSSGRRQVDDSEKAGGATPPILVHVLIAAIAVRGIWNQGPVDVVVQGPRRFRNVQDVLLRLGDVEELLQRGQIKPRIVRHLVERPRTSVGSEVIREGLPVNMLMRAGAGSRNAPAACLYGSLEFLDNSVPPLLGLALVGLPLALRDVGKQLRGMGSD